VGEDLGAEVIDQALPDPGGHVSRADSQDRRQDGHDSHREGEPHDQAGVVAQDAVVEDVLDQQRVDHDQSGVEHHEAHEDGDQPFVGDGEPHDAPHRVPGQLLLDH
jgi:hypothetical protein